MLHIAIGKTSRQKSIMAMIRLNQTPTTGIRSSSILRLRRARCHRLRRSRSTFCKTQGGTSCPQRVGESRSRLCRSTLAKTTGNARSQKRFFGALRKQRCLRHLGQPREENRNLFLIFRLHPRSGFSQFPRRFGLPGFTGKDSATPLSICCTRRSWIDERFGYGQNFLW